ncbi:hypothetical protein RHGRI_018069 [Rhododendron griersonianum]|uniref:CRESS-DNA virus Rep endonuclease domain-containing protein n=1 Tax=Rhododendron griersonianum TaxID=479676 RepID=A0AAV6K043_9ERIC|nr:hypothetical protein RHGRI_018069 [Rhododendron griersonianum]
MSAMGINNSSGVEALASSGANLKGVALKAKHVAEAALSSSLLMNHPFIQFFDLTSATGSEQYHGNYQATRDAATVNDYIAKEGVFVEHGEFTGRKRKSSADEVYRETISQDNTESALEVIRQGAPCPNSAYKAFLDKPENEALRIWTEGNAIFVVLQEALFTSADQGGAQES